METPDITEVKSLVDNLQFLEKHMTDAVNRWKKDNTSCDMLGGKSIEKILKKLCETPGILSSEVYQPLYSFLNAYIANREGRIAFTGRELDAFLLRGLRAIQQYIVISDFFARNPYYFVPLPPVSQGIHGVTKASVDQKQYKEFVLNINERLIGCKNNLNFLFLRLISTVKNLNPEMAQMKEYLTDQCNSIRIAKLRI